MREKEEGQTGRKKCREAEREKVGEGVEAIEAKKENKNRMIFVVLVIIPGQPPASHSPVSLSGPRLEQSFPPALGGGLVQVRMRV